jgi:hypothetical protein
VVTISTVAVYLAGVLAAYAMTDQSLMTLLMGWYMWRQLYGQKVIVSVVSGLIVARARSSGRVGRVARARSGGRERGRGGGGGERLATGMFGFDRYWH